MKAEIKITDIQSVVDNALSPPSRADAGSLILKVGSLQLKVFLSPKEDYIKTLIHPAQRMTAELSVLLINFKAPVADSVHEYLRDGYLPKFTNPERTEQVVCEEVPITRKVPITIEELIQLSRESKWHYFTEQEYKEILYRLRKYIEPRSSRSFNKLLGLILRQIRSRRISKKTIPNPTYLTVRKASQMFGVSKAYLHKHTSNGNLPFEKHEIFGYKLIPVKKLSKFLHIEKRITPKLEIELTDPSYGISYAKLLEAICIIRDIKKPSARKFIKRLQDKGCSLKEIRAKLKSSAPMTRSFTKEEKHHRSKTGRDITGSEPWNWE